MQGAAFTRSRIRSSSSRLSNPATREEVKKFTDGMLSDFFAKDKPLAEILPQEVTENVRNRLQPLVRDSLSRIVGSVDLTPVTERIRGLMKTYVDRFFDSNTGFFDSLASKVIKGMKGDKIEQTIDEFADTFPDWLVNYLTSEEGTNQVTDYAQNAVDQMLQMSPSQIAGKLDLESMAQLRGAAADIVTTVVRSEEVASVTARYIEISLADVKDEELESILRRTKLAEPSEVYREISSFVVDKMRSDEALDRLLARASLLFRQLLEKPVGRLDRLIPQQAIVSFGNLLNQTMFDYLSYHSAELIQSLEIQETIYDKIANWEPRELHRVIMKATRENLRWLEILGGILGFIVGAISGGAVVLLS
ncbi:MAG: DUF445 family protein [Planctomycetota bacterium]|nr:DUF445 family protein [Planctomycetota bacterium]